TDWNSVGRMYTIPTQTCEALRALGVFQRRQQWQYFNRPSTMLRKESVVVGRGISFVEGGGRKSAKKDDALAEVDLTPLNQIKEKQERKQKQKQQQQSPGKSEGTQLSYIIT